MKNKDKAEKKFDIIIDKLHDLLSIVPDNCTYQINNLLDKVNDVRYSIDSKMEESI